MEHAALGYEEESGLPVDTGAELANAGEMHQDLNLEEKDRGIWRKRRGVAGDGPVGQWQWFVSC